MRVRITDVTWIAESTPVVGYAKSSENVAIDGITRRGQVGDRLQVAAEMEPPGGWVDVGLDAATGRQMPTSGK